MTIKSYGGKNWKAKKKKKNNWDWYWIANVHDLLLNQEALKKKKKDSNSQLCIFRNDLDGCQNGILIFQSCHFPGLSNTPFPDSLRLKQPFSMWVATEVFSPENWLSFNTKHHLSPESQHAPGERAHGCKWCASSILDKAGKFQRCVALSSSHSYGQTKKT